jgi:hypothetical protein
LSTTNTTFGTVNTSLGTINTSYQAAYAQANTAGTNAGNAYGQANAAYAQANSAYGAANNRVLKAGDTMTGQLNVSSGGLLVTGNVGFGMPSPIFPLQVKTNTGTPPQALQLNTTDWTTTIGSAFQFGFGAATGNTYSEIRALSGGYNVWNNLVLQSGGGDVGIGTTSPGSRLHVVTDSADSTGFNFETTGSGGKTFFAVHKLGFIRIRSSDTNGAAMHMFDNAGSKRAEFSIGSDSKLNWYSDALTSNWLTFDGGNGRVGIGLTSPSYPFEIASSSSISFAFQRTGVSAKKWGFDSDNNYMYIRNITDNSINFTLSNAGNVGIGTLTPGQRLEVSGGNISYKPSVGNSVRIGDDESYGTSGTGRYTALGFSSMSNGGNRIFAHNTGEDGIFICAATSRAVVIRAGGSGTDHSVFTSAGNFYTNGYITNIRGNASVSAPSTSDHSLGTRIALYDNSATSWYAMGIESDTMWFNSDSNYKWYADAVQRMLLDGSGNLTIAGTLTESSSITLKENVSPINNALDAITNLVGVTYDRKDGSAKQRAGLIAEEVEQVLPNVVQKDNDGNPSGIQYTNLIAYLVESIKELKAEIDILKKQNGTVS